MKTLSVKLKHNSYQIFISDWDLAHSARILQTHLKEDRLFIVTNKTIAKYYQKILSKALPKGIQAHWIIIGDGERFKNLTTCEKIHTQLSHAGANRQSLLLALGGGVVGDIAGFVAATYMRGIPYIQMPTTLLAQVDSSVGGKTGVDLKTGKNLVGAFYQPKTVLIHTRFLKTLPSRELRCGLAEVVKYGCIRDATFFAHLEKNAERILKLDAKLLTDIIHGCCAIKAEVVGKDEFEGGVRAILNFGHTLGHAIEAITGFTRVKHGEAVAMGMVFAAKLSHTLDPLMPDEAPRIANVLKRFGLPTRWPTKPKSAYARAMGKDKKASRHHVKFVLLKKIGHVTMTPLTIPEIVRWL